MGKNYVAGYWNSIELLLRRTLVLSVILFNNIRLFNSNVCHSAGIYTPNKLEIFQGLFGV